MHRLSVYIRLKLSVIFSHKNTSRNSQQLRIQAETTNEILVVRTIKGNVAKGALEREIKTLRHTQLGMLFTTLKFDTLKYRPVLVSISVDSVWLSR